MCHSNALYFYDMTWQRFAKDLSGRLVDVYNVSDAYVLEHGNDTFRCVECGNPMLTKRGKVKEWHFAHVGGKNVVCSFESYLHKVGIIKFVEAYKAKLESNEPYLLEVAKGRACYRGVCPYGMKDPCRDIEGYGVMPLLPYFGKIETGVRDGDFVPDILLTAADGRKIYIEIVVTHFSEPRKIASGVPIVEIELKSEDDLALFTERLLSQRRDIVNMFNFDQFMTKVDYQCETALQNAKNQFVELYRRCVQERYPLKLEHSVDIMCSRENCPYIEGHSCTLKDHREYDIARYCKEVLPDNATSVFSPDFYVETQKEGVKIRFNFCYRLFTKAETFGDVRTIQFSLDKETKSEPWLSTSIWDKDDGIRYFNFVSHEQRDLCKDGLPYFELIIQYNSGEAKCLGVMRIDQIHQAMSQIWDDVGDYILVPSADGRQAPTYDGKYLQSLFEKSCNACLHCLDKRVTGSLEHTLTCQLRKRGCVNEDALDCEAFKRNLKVRYGKMNWYSYSYKYRGSERILEAWRRYRLKK